MDSLISMVSEYLEMIFSISTIVNMVFGESIIFSISDVALLLTVAINCGMSASSKFYRKKTKQNTKCYEEANINRTTSIILYEHRNKIKLPQLYL